jgi:hypothetical protein
MAIDPLPLDFGRDKRFYVYVYRDPRRGKKLQPVYIGKGTRRPERWRADEHWRDIRCTNRVLGRVLTKIRKSGLVPVIEIVGWFDDEQYAFKLERSLIALFGRRDIGTGSLCNLSEGGDGGGSGHVMSQEQKDKLSLALKGRTRPQPPGTLAAHLGAKRTPEARAKMRAAKLGKRHTLEHRQRNSDAQRGRKQSPDVVTKREEKLSVVRADPEYHRRLSEGALRAWARRKANRPKTDS